MSEANALNKNSEASKMLEVKNLCIQFGGLKAVDSLNLTIYKGQLYGLIGPNGAGKTTVFNMLTNGETVIKKVLAVLPDGKTGAPCGACRELMVQLMPDNYKEIEIMLDYENEKIVNLGALTPEWWI